MSWLCRHVSCWINWLPAGPYRVLYFSGYCDTQYCDSSDTTFLSDKNMTGWLIRHIVHPGAAVPPHLKRQSLFRITSLDSSVTLFLLWMLLWPSKFYRGFVVLRTFFFPGEICRSRFSWCIRGSNLWTSHFLRMSTTMPTKGLMLGFVCRCSL